jgi:integrase
LSPATFNKARWTFETLLFPRLGDQPVTMIKAPDLLAALRKIEARGTYETTHRAKQRCGQIFRYAIATGRAEHDISVRRMLRELENAGYLTRARSKKRDGRWAWRVESSSVIRQCPSIAVPPSTAQPSTAKASIYSIL